MNENEIQMNPFDKRYPVTQKPIEGTPNLEYTAYIFDEVGEPREFSEIIAILDNAIEGDTFVFKLNTPGGRLDSTLSIIDAIENTNAQVACEVTGDVASAGTMIALSCHSLYIAPYAEFMCHYFTAGMYGKGNELKARSKFMHENNEALFHKVYKKFLTKKEVRELIKGEDFYMGKDEVEARYQRVVDHRVKQFEEEQKAAEEANDRELAEYLRTKGFKIK